MRSVPFEYCLVESVVGLLRHAIFTQIVRHETNRNLIIARTSLPEIIPDTEVEVITITNPEENSETEMETETEKEIETEQDRESRKLETSDETLELPPCPDILPRPDLSKSADIDSLGQ